MKSEIVSMIYKQQYHKINLLKILLILKNLTEKISVLTSPSRLLFNGT